MIFAPPGFFSSLGWKMSRTVPASSSRISFSTRATPSSMAVWASWPQACIRPSCSLLKSNVLASTDGERVDVGAKGADGPGPGALDVSDDAGLRDARYCMQSQPLQRLGDERGRLVLLERELGAAVELAAEADDLGEHVVGELADAVEHGRRGGERRSYRPLAPEAAVRTCESLASGVGQTCTENTRL